MFIVLLVILLAVWSLCLAVVISGCELSRQEKIWLVVGCLVLTLVTVIVRAGQLHYSREYRQYSFERNGLCIEFKDLACRDIPFGVDKCNVVRAEVKCVSQPEWWGK